MFDLFLMLVFALSSLLFFYHHFAYPILLSKWARARRQAGKSANKRPEPLKEEELPGMALLIPVYNEAAMIADKVANLAQIDYPRDRLTILMALDGCTDETFELATKAIAALGAGAPHIELVNHPENRGKIALLNEHIAKQKAQIIALNDTTAMIEPDALRRAAAYFAEPKVGVVCATYRLSEAESEGERAYWDYQTQIKENEATIASVIGPHGAFYLFRRRLWTPLPGDTINDDFILPMRIVADGYRAVYDREIIAVEAERTTSAQGFARRIRIGAGNMQQMLRLLRLGSPRLGWVAFLFLSGKALRPLISFLVLLAVLASALLAWRGWWIFQLILLLEVILFALSALVIWRKGKNWPKPLAWLGYLVEGHAASFLGALRVISGKGMRW